ncbi:hypothetical protein NQ318_023353 [Aromia moschata]|uniref:Uncharacterized protein n=1 Tax=Aromia moschata TaxID=1265417 RepID=A0AAV8XBM5_9CUCU|nr:hypothetical protein NQ318_023353 [Aromia moschata]
MTSEVAISWEVHPFAFAAASNCLRYMDHDDCPSYVGGLNCVAYCIIKFTVPYLSLQPSYCEIILNN